MSPDQVDQPMIGGAFGEDRRLCLQVLEGGEHGAPDIREFRSAVAATTGASFDQSLSEASVHFIVSGALSPHC